MPESPPWPNCDASLNFLYSLYAALEDIGWDEVSEAEKARLGREAGVD